MTTPMSPDLDPAVEAAMEALSLEQTGSWYRSLVVKAVAAAAPLIRAQEREATEERLAGVDIGISTTSPLHDLWCAAVDAAVSPDFRIPPGDRCLVCDHAIGDLDEALYLRRQRRAIEAAEAQIRADERAAGKVVGRWYESFTPDGKLWCGTSDPTEVVKASVGKGCTFRVIVTRQVVAVEPWTPEHVTPEERPARHA